MSCQPLGLRLPGNLDLSVAKTDGTLQYECAREGLKDGLVLGAKLGTSPHKFGIQGATDVHASVPRTQADNFLGRQTGYEAGPERMILPLTEKEVGKIMAWVQLASGLNAVWAR